MGIYIIKLFIYLLRKDGGHLLWAGKDVTWKGPMEWRWGLLGADDTLFLYLGSCYMTVII